MASAGQIQYFAFELGGLDRAVDGVIRQSNPVPPQTVRSVYTLKTFSSRRAVARSVAPKETSPAAVYRVAGVQGSSAKRDVSAPGSVATPREPRLKSLPAAPARTPGPFHRSRLCCAATAD